MARNKPAPSDVKIRSGTSIKAHTAMLIKRCQERDPEFPREFSAAVERLIIFYAEQKHPGLLREVMEYFRTNPTQALLEVMPQRASLAEIAAEHKISERRASRALGEGVSAAPAKTAQGSRQT